MPNLFIFKSFERARDGECNIYEEKDHSNKLALGKPEDDDDLHENSAVASSPGLKYKGVKKTPKKKNASQYSSINRKTAYSHRKFSK